jgi:drug/metabolite transporter (DMT)-like permease
MTAYFTPVVAVMIDWLARGRMVTLWQWLGTLLICASAVIETGRDHRSESPASTGQ